MTVNTSHAFVSVQDEKVEHGPESVPGTKAATFGTARLSTGHTRGYHSRYTSERLLGKLWITEYDGEKLLAEGDRKKKRREPKSIWRREGIKGKFLKQAGRGDKGAAPSKWRFFLAI